MLSQSQFAKLFGVSVKTLQNWEQAHRQPTGPAAALLRSVEREPATTLRALRSQAALRRGGARTGRRRRRPMRHGQRVHTARVVEPVVEHPRGQTIDYNDT